MKIRRPAYLSTVIFFSGKTSHASGSPWEAINALDAVVSMYNNISVMRQQIKMTDRVHCTILKGGEQPNVIPDETQIWYKMRSMTSDDSETLKKKLMACAEAAALGTGIKSFHQF